MEGYVKCFGTGPGKTNGERAYSAYYFLFGETGVMVDCGEPLSLNFKLARGDVDGFDALLISHTHPDHIGGFLSFMQALKHGERQRPLDIHVPGHAIPALKALMEVAYMFPESLPFSFEFHKLEAERSFTVGGVRITPFATTHLEKTRSRYEKVHKIPFEAFSFLFQADKVAVAHSADIGKAQDLSPLLRVPLQLLVVELSHASPEDLFELLATRSIMRSAFVHLRDADWKKRGLLRREAASKLKRTRVFFPKDGQQIPF